MTTNQTIDGVPRELRALLERVVGKSSQTPHWDALDEDRIAAAAELRALLDAPTCKTPSGAACPGDGVGPCKKCPAAQPQGEPVERQPDAIIEGVMTSVGITHAIYASTVSLKHGEQVKLYAEQPAPVAVVMPEQLNPAELDELEVIEALLSGQGLSNLAGTMAAARQFIDELTRLNTK